MAFPTMYLLIFLLIVAAVFVIALFFWGIKHALALAMNSIIGFFALYAVQAWILSNLVIGFFSVLLVALFGIVGLIFVVTLHLVGVWF